MFLNYSKFQTPKTSTKWKNLKSEERIEKINKILKYQEITKNFKVSRVPDNGLVVYKKKILFKSIKKINNNSFGFNAELLIRSLAVKNNYQTIPYKLRRVEKITNALKINNIIDVVYNIFKLRFTI